MLQDVAARDVAWRAELDVLREAAPSPGHGVRGRTTTS